MNRDDVKYYGILAIEAMAIIALGIVIVYYSVAYFNQIEFLKIPCDLCLEQKPQLQQCFYNLYNTKYTNNTIINLSFALR